MPRKTTNFILKSQMPLHFVKTCPVVLKTSSESNDNQGYFGTMNRARAELRNPRVKRPTTIIQEPVTTSKNESVWYRLPILF